MTKTATDARRAVLPAFGAAAAMSAMIFASRLPVTLDFILPRRAGWPLFVLAYEALERTGSRQAFSVMVALLFVGALVRFAGLIGGTVRGRKWTPAQFLARGFMLALIGLLLRWSFSIWFEVSQKVWFPFGSLNVVEPCAHFISCSLILFCGMAATLAVLSPRPPPVSRTLLPWAVTNGLAALLAVSLYGAWSSPAQSVSERRLFVVLTEEEGRPGQVAYDLPIASERGPLKVGVGRLESLRALYEVQAKLMDPAGLRQALMLGVKDNDDLARTLLLAHLSAAPPSPAALGALGALADETAHRIGAIGYSRIALAYAHLGDLSQAAVWAARASQAAHGIPAGLLDLSGGGALMPGRISGKLEGLMPLKIALYRKTDPGAPYLLDAAALVASTQPDSKGRFSFTGLTAGRYYLAFAFSAGVIPRISGLRGDLSLDARKAFIDIPPLTIK